MRQLCTYTPVMYVYSPLAQSYYMHLLVRSWTAKQDSEVFSMYVCIYVHSHTCVCTYVCELSLLPFQHIPFLSLLPLFPSLLFHPPPYTVGSLLLPALRLPCWLLMTGATSTVGDWECTLPHPPTEVGHAHPRAVKLGLLGSTFPSLMPAMSEPLS